MNFPQRLFKFNGLPLPEGLIAAWNLEDETDSFGTNDLTNNNGVTFVAGKINNAANFDGINQSLSIADNTDLSYGVFQKQTICGWFKCDTIPAGNTPVVAKWNAAGNLEYLIDITAAGAFRYIVSSDGTATTGIILANGIIVPDVWYFFVCWYDRVKLYVELNNNGTIFSTAYTGDIFNGNSPFVLGNRTGATFFDGLIDAVRVYKNIDRVLTATERSALYNNGLGRQYQTNNIISSDEVNRELDQIVNLLIGLTNDITPSIGFDSSQDAPLTINQNGEGPILQCWNGGTSPVFEILKNGQIKSYLATGISPISLTSSSLVDNLNVDMVDGLHSTDILQINSYIPLVDSVFFDGIPASGDRKIINQQGTRLLSILAQQRGTASSNAVTTITLKKDNQLETVLGTITISGNTQSMLEENITDIDLDVDRLIFEITTITGTTKHSDITVGVVTRQLPV